eukprot:3685546-Amphidinium_carterae.2
MPSPLPEVGCADPHLRLFQGSGNCLFGQSDGCLLGCNLVVATVPAVKKGYVHVLLGFQENSWNVFCVVAATCMLPSRALRAMLLVAPLDLIT